MATSLVLLATLCCMFVTSQCISEQELFSNGYELVPGVGYYKLHTEKKSWTDAEATCASEGTHLTIPNSKKEKKTYTALIDKYWTETNVYVGMHTLFDDSVVTFVTGNPITTTPVEYYLSNVINNSTISYSRWDMFFWTPPDRELAFICEQELWQTYELYRGVGYYKLHTKGDTWIGAYQTCADEGGHLAVVNSAKEARVLRDILWRYPDLNDAEDNDNVAVGFHLLYDIRLQVDDKKKTYNTIFGGSLKNSGYEKWAPGQPRVSELNQCGSMNRKGQYSISKCNAKLAFFCEKDI